MPRTFFRLPLFLSMYVLLSGCDSTISQWIGVPQLKAPNAPAEFETPIVATKTELKIANGPTQEMFLPTELSGGTPPFQFSMVSGPGEINPSTGKYKTPYSFESSVVRVTDSKNKSIDLQIRNRPALVNGAILASAVDGTDAFLGGDFDQINANASPYFGVFHRTSATISDHVCNYKALLRAKNFAIYSTLFYDGYVFLAGSVRGATYGDETLGPIVKIKLSNCEIDKVFNQKAKTLTGVSFPYARKIAIDSATNSLYIAGRFDTYNGSTVSNLIKLDIATGDLDTTFSQATGANNLVTVVALKDNHIYIAGDFTTYRGSPAQRVAKIHKSTGALDTTFTQSTGLSSGVTLTIHDGLIAGNAIFIATQSNGGNVAYRGVATSSLVKLDVTTGNLDTSFSQAGDFGWPHKVMRITTDGSNIWVGGEFDSFRSVSSPRLIKLDSNGNMITGFNWGTGATGGGPFFPFYNPATQDLFVLSSDELYNGTPTKAIMKIDKDTGVRDMAFESTYVLPSTLYFDDISFLPSNEIWINLEAPVLLSGISKKGLIKINLSTMQQDATFNIGTGFNGSVTALLVSGSYIYVGGTFTTYNGQPAVKLAKIHKTTGVLDTTFTQATGLTAAIFPVVINSLATDGTGLYACGYISGYRGTTVQNLIRVLLSNGNLDTTFTQTTGLSTSMAFDSCYSVIYGNNSIYVGGSFPSYRGNSNIKYLAKLHPTTGGVDATFTTNPGIVGTRVNSLLIDNSELYVAGDFSTYRGSSTPNLIKLHVDSGNLDSAFHQTTSANKELTILGLYDYQLFLGTKQNGDLTSYRGSGVNNFFSVSTTNADLNPIYNTNFGPSVNKDVSTLFKYSGRYYIGGTFIEYRTSPAPYFTVIDPSTGDSP